MGILPDARVAIECNMEERDDHTHPNAGSACLRRWPKTRRQGENKKKTNIGEPLEEEKSTREPLDEATPWGVRDIATPWDQSMPRNFEKVTFFVNSFIFEHHMKETKTTCSKTGKIFAFICKEDKKQQKC